MTKLQRLEQDKQALIEAFVTYADHLKFCPCKNKKHSEEKCVCGYVFMVKYLLKFELKKGDSHVKSKRL